MKGYNPFKADPPPMSSILPAAALTLFSVPAMEIDAAIAASRGDCAASPTTSIPSHAEAGMGGAAGTDTVGAGAGDAPLPAFESGGAGVPLVDPAGVS